MSNTAATYHTQSAPESWATESYTVRRPGNTAWEDGLNTFAAAEKSRDIANRQAPGHRIYAEQVYIGDISSMRGQTRAVERG